MRGHNWLVRLGRYSKKIWNMAEARKEGEVSALRAMTGAVSWILENGWKPAAIAAGVSSTFYFATPRTPTLAPPPEQAITAPAYRPQVYTPSPSAEPPVERLRIDEPLSPAELRQ